MRIFIGLGEVAGYYRQLSKGFRELGHQVVFIDLSGNHFQYQDGETSTWLERLFRFVPDNIKIVHTENKLKRSFLSALQRVSKLFLLLYTVLLCDVVIFGFGSSLYRYYEMPLLKKFQKKLVYVFHGTDSRPHYLSGYANIQNAHLPIDEFLSLIRNQKRMIEWVDRYADVIINHPPQAYFHTRKFAQFLRIGIPFEIETSANQISSMKTDLDQAIRILHAPSYPQAKGTDEIRRVIQNLKSKGHRIDFIEIIRMPHSEVLRELTECDFVIDELYSDTPMATFVAEAATFGKPAVVGGYYSKYIRNDLSDEFIPPSLFCSPDELEQSVERLIVDQVFRLELGSRAREYVAREWNPKKVAERFLRLIENRIPQDWWYDPYQNSYLHGVGFPEEKIRASLRNTLERGGRGALQLSDKPQLERKLVDFAYQSAPDLKNPQEFSTGA